MMEKSGMQFFREVMSFLNESDPLALNSPPYFIWCSFCLFAEGEIQTGAAVLRLGCGDASLRPNDRSRHHHAINAGDRRLAVTHLSRRLGGIRALSRLSVFLFGRCREPCADAEPL